MTWNFSSVPHERRAGLVWLVLALLVHGAFLGLGFYLRLSGALLAVGGFTLLLVVIGLVRWVDSRRVARKVEEAHSRDDDASVSLWQGVLRSRDPQVRIEVGGRLLKVRVPKTTLSRRDARALTPLERVSVLGWQERTDGDGRATIEVDRALVHPGDVEGLRQRILQHGDYYAVRWGTASLGLLLIGAGVNFML